MDRENYYGYHRVMKCGGDDGFWFKKNCGRENDIDKELLEDVGVEMIKK